MEFEDCGAGSWEKQSAGRTLQAGWRQSKTEVEKRRYVEEKEATQQRHALVEKRARTHLLQVAQA